MSRGEKIIVKKNIAVIGAGNGGTAIAAYLASCGAKINLCDLFPEFIEGIIKAGGIDLTINGKTSHQVMDKVTTDVAETIRDIQLIMIVTPSFTHGMIARLCAKSLEDGQIIVLNPGRTGGAVEFLETIRKEGCNKNVIISEAQTLVYACRKVSDCAVEVYSEKNEVVLGTLPSNRTQEVLDVLTPFYPEFKPAENCLQTSLSNIGALFHPTPILLNIGRIENDKNGYRYYWDGITPAVAKLIHEIDNERMSVAKAYNVSVLSAEEWLKCSYDTYGDTLYELLQHNNAYADIKAPKTIDARYVTEDIPMSLVPISELGKLAGVETPNIDAIIKLTSTIYSKDFRNEGRSAKNLGLEGMSVDQIVKFFQTGKK